MDAIDALYEALKPLNPMRNVQMRTLTTFGLGGPADILVCPRHEDEILQALRSARSYELPVHIMGNGSNLLVRDGGLRGLVIQIGAGMAAVSCCGDLLTASAGASLTSASRFALLNGLMGLEWACGIPGTIGGGCAMNAGAYRGCMGQLLKKVRYLKEDGFYWHTLAGGDMGYRRSIFQAPDIIALRAEIQLTHDDGNAKERQDEYMRQRREKQPISAKSAGSVFKRPEGYFAGELIERAGLKGFRIGGACVSALHAGFIINDRDASAQDVISLIETIQARVYDAFGVELQCELKIWGEDT